MLSFVAALVIGGAGRTTPITIPTELRQLKFKLETGIAFSRRQIGHLQIASWSATTTASPDTLRKALSRWGTSQSDYNLQFERKEGNVTILINVFELGEGKKRTVRITETPPLKNPPTDWPDSLRRNLFVIYPDLLPQIQTVDPDSAEMTMNPQGLGGSATWSVPDSFAKVVAAVKHRFPTWSPVESPTEVRLNPPRANMGSVPAGTHRRVGSITISNKNGHTQLSTTWYEGMGGGVGFAPVLSRVATVKFPPPIKLAGALGKISPTASVTRTGMFGHWNLQWGGVLNTPITEATRDLKRSEGLKGADSRTMLKGAYASLNKGPYQGTVSVSAGRLGITHTVPKGWRLASHEPYSESVILDPKTTCTVSISLAPTSRRATWPASATYTWPLRKGMECPLPEMKDEPKWVVSWSNGDQLTINATWEVRVSSTRAEELAKYQVRNTTGALKSISVSRSREGMTVISAGYQF